MRRALVVLLLSSACRSSTAPLAPSQPPPPPSLASTPVAVAPTPTPAPVEPPPVERPVTGGCEPEVAPIERVIPGLVVHAPPDAPRDPGFRGRLRTHTDGALDGRTQRVWVGPNVPAFVPLSIGAAELFLLERDGDDYVALYREPYGTGSCTLSDASNCGFVVRGFRSCAELYTLQLNEFMSRRTHLELQDLRVAGGVIYFNEACQSYAKEARGRCSALVAVDARTGKLLWRTRHLVSNNRFLVLDRYIVTGYGFTAERDALFVVRRSDGAVVHKRALPHAHEDLQIDADGRLVVTVYGDAQHVFELRGFDGDRPQLVPVGAPGTGR